MKWTYAVLYHQNGQAPQYRGWNLDGRIQDHFSGLSQSEVLNRLGTEGWELVSAVHRHGEPDPQFYLKRPA